ncbi:hypothetical protein NSERUTF1_3718 [Nocardia seriolae]|nr:hypothetical protein NSERUTF1_3718 [Nocardia seriolae]
MPSLIGGIRSHRAGPCTRGSGGGRVVPPLDHGAVRLQ